MQILTHQAIDQKLCGRPMEVEEGASRVELITLPSMSADECGLVHGGFVFGLADYAAMLAVNHPNVVLGAADVEFLKPVRVGETICAHAKVEQVGGKKHRVSVSVDRDGEIIFKGIYTCFVLESHILESTGKR